MITTFRPTHLAALAALTLALAGVAVAVRLAEGSVPPHAAPAIGGHSDTTPFQATPADSSSSAVDAPAVMPATDLVPLAVPQQPAAGADSGGSIVTTPDAGATSTTPAAGSGPSSDAYGAAPSRWSEWPNDMSPSGVLTPTQSSPKLPLPQTNP